MGGDGRRWEEMGGDGRRREETATGGETGSGRRGDRLDRRTRSVSTKADTLIRRPHREPGMNGLVPVTGIAAVVATVLMVIAMLYLVWLSMGDGTHAPSPDDGEHPELDEGDGEESQPEVTDGTSA
jgi:hypothetical protein